MRGRREVGLVGDAAAGVEAHRPRAQPRAQVGGEVARGAVVAGHDHGRAAHVAVGDRRDQERAQRLRDEGARARLLEARRRRDGARDGGGEGGETSDARMPSDRAKARPGCTPESTKPPTRRARAPRRGCRTGAAGPPRAPRPSPPGPSPRARARARRASDALPGSVAGSSGIGPTPKACTNHARLPDAGVEVEALADALLGQQQRHVVGAGGQARARQPALGEHRDQLEPAQQEVRGQHPGRARSRSGRSASAGHRRARRRRRPAPKPAWCVAAAQSTKRPAIGCVAQRRL